MGLEHWMGPGLGAMMCYLREEKARIAYGREIPRLQ